MTEEKCTVSASVDRDDVFYKEKMRLLGEWDLPLEHHISESDEELPGMLCAALRIKYLDEIELYRCDGASSVFRFMVSPRNERLSLGYLEKESKRLLSDAEDKGHSASSERNFCKLVYEACNRFVEPVTKDATIGSEVMDAEHSAAYNELISAEKQKFPLRVLEFPETGRGVASTDDIPKGSPVYSVRVDLVLSAEAALAHPKLGPALAAEGLDSDTMVLLYVLYERANPASRHRTYFDMLPAFTNAFSFDPMDMHTLMGTPVFDELMDARENLHAIYTELFPALTKKYPDVFLEDVFSWDAFVWARCLFDTRAFACIRNGTKQTYLMPLADMLNHNPYAHLASPVFDEDSQSFVFRAFADVPKNTQIFLNYGSLSNRELVLYYGFFDEENPYDIIPIDFYPPEDELEEEKMETLEKFGLTTRNYLIRHPHLDSIEVNANSIYEVLTPRLFGALRVCTSDRHTLTQMGKAGAMSPKTLVPTSFKQEHDAIVPLADVIESLLENFETTVEEDDEILADDTEDDPLEFTTKIAVQYRRRYKATLATYRAHCAASLEYLKKHI